jgi:hypothetical protein
MEPLFDLSQVRFTLPELLEELTIEVMKWQGDENLKADLQEHGVTLTDTDEYTLLIFPAGTMWARSKPALWEDFARYTLPDGFTIDLIYMSKGRSIISNAYQSAKKQR